MSNAIKFSLKDHQIRVRIIEEAGTDGEMKVRIVVKDTGVGMSKEELEDATKPSSKTEEFGPSQK